MYLKKGRKLIFVDFCNVTNVISPTSQLYGVDFSYVDENDFGQKAIQKLDFCPIIPVEDEDKQATWDMIDDTFLDAFKCVRLQGSNYYDWFVVITFFKFI